MVEMTLTGPLDGRNSFCFYFTLACLGCSKNSDRKAGPESLTRQATRANSLCSDTKLRGYGWHAVRACIILFTCVDVAAERGNRTSSRRKPIDISEAKQGEGSTMLARVAEAGEVKDKSRNERTQASSTPRLRSLMADVAVA